MAARRKWAIRSWLRLGVSTLAAVPSYASKLKSMREPVLSSLAQLCCGPAPLFRPQRTKYTQASAATPNSAREKRGDANKTRAGFKTLFRSFRINKLDWSKRGFEIASSAFLLVASPVCSGKEGRKRDSKGPGAASLSLLLRMRVLTSPRTLHDSNRTHT